MYRVGVSQKGRLKGKVIASHGRTEAARFGWRITQIVMDATDPVERAMQVERAVDAQQRRFTLG